MDIGADEFFRPLADFNLNGFVDIIDLLIQNNDWLKSGNNMPGDLFEDQFIDMSDFVLFQRWWDG